MRQLLLTITLLLVSNLLFGAGSSFPDSNPNTVATVPMDIPSFFTPVPQDFSVWALGNIFGTDLIQSQQLQISSIKLLSKVFGVFNQIALVVGIIIVIYTIIAGTLNTAHEGKPMGEKWHSLWMPVRTTLGIAFLVPKGGSGYCMAQYLIMWLTLQGIGAADTVWSTALAYFEQGGAIYSNITANTSTYLNTTTIDPVYNYAAIVQMPGCTPNDATCLPASSATLTKRINMLLNMSCVESYNQNTSLQQLTGVKAYSAYLPDSSDRPDLIYFGNPHAGTVAASASLPQATNTNLSTTYPGAECGFVIAGIGQATSADPTAAKQIYGTALYNLAQSTDTAAQWVVKMSSGAKPSDPTSSFQSIQQGVSLFINYIAGYTTILQPPAQTNRTPVTKALNQYGWILAGNYYTILSNYGDETNSAGIAAVIQGQYISPNIQAYQPPPAPTSGVYPYQDALISYYQQFEAWGDQPVTAGATGVNSPNADAQFYNIYGFNTSSVNTKSGTTGGVGNKNYIGIIDTDSLISTLVKQGPKELKASSSNSYTARMVDNFMRLLSGQTSSGRQVAKDPILRAALFGKGLTQAAIVLLTAAMVAAAAIMGLTAIGSWMSSGGYAAAAVLSFTTPWAMALGSFMYTGGAGLGVFLPLIPFVTFLVGVIGWFLQVIESIAAAPLVAIGLIMPESKDEIWGRAAPAYMMTLNLFLRPSLMIVGFISAMIITWIVVSLLNVGFLVLSNITFQIESAFGYVTILMAYTGLLLYVVTECYSLITMVPNKVLTWIGDQTMATKGAEAALQGAKADVEKGAGAVGAGAGHATEGRHEAAQNWREHEDFDEEGGIAGGKGSSKGSSNPGGGGDGGGKPGGGVGKTGNPSHIPGGDVSPKK